MGTLPPLSPGLAGDRQPSTAPCLPLEHRELGCVQMGLLISFSQKTPMDRRLLVFLSLLCVPVCQVPDSCTSETRAPSLLGLARSTCVVCKQRSPWLHYCPCVISSTQEAAEEFRDPKVCTQLPWMVLNQLQQH